LFDTQPKHNPRESVGIPINKMPTL
jgi:hypothetical protein